MLVKEGNARVDSGLLDKAIRSSRVELARFLALSMDDLQQVGYSVDTSIREGNEDLALFLLNLSSRAIDNGSWSSLLYVAAENGQAAVVLDILRRYPKTNEERRDSVDDALFVAVGGDHLDAVRVLVQYGKADVNSQVFGKKNTPLGEAAKYGHTEIYLYLVEQGIRQLFKYFAYLSF